MSSSRPTSEGRSRRISPRRPSSTLSNSVQHLHVDNVNGAKAEETRQRRIDKAITLFLEGKQR